MKQTITMKKSKTPTVNEAWDMFIRKCNVRNLSPNTIKTYNTHYGIFCEFISNETLVSEIDSYTVDEFILYVRESNNINDVTVNSYLRTIRVFLYYCMDCKYMDSFKIRMTKVEKKIKETYTTEELERLLAKPDINSCTFAEYKTWVFENYLLGTGNRISSALNVQIKDVNFDDNVIIMRKAKNRRQQILPLSNTLADILKEYLETRGNNPDDYLFCNNYGEQGLRRTYQQLVHDYNIKHNVNKTSCHLFRHTFAKQWILAGGDIFRLQKILGHSDLTVTKEYVNMFGADLQLDYEKFNPLDRLNSTKPGIKMK